MEIECFVLVACPENSLIDSKVGLPFSGVRRIAHSFQDFLRPIITPFELEVALQAEGTWSGQYVLDFEKLLAAKSEGGTLVNITCVRLFLNYP